MTYKVPFNYDSKITSCLFLMSTTTFLKGVLNLAVIAMLW